MGSAPEVLRPENPRDVLEDLMDRCRLQGTLREEYVRRLSRAMLLELAIARRIFSSEES